MAKKLGLNVSFGLNTKDFSTKMQNVRRDMKRTGASLRAIGLGVGAVAGTAITFGLKAVRAWDEQAQAIAQVEAGLKSTNNAAGLTSKQLQRMASDLQSNSIFGDETILRDATANLLTFTNIAGDQFARTQQSVLDLATRMGTDLKSAAIQLGKALNDPVANLSALSRSGIQFSDAQKTLIKSLWETNQQAEAQKVILEELENQFGGSAKAAADAGLGGFKQLSNTFGDLTEQIGKSLMPYLNKLEKVLRDVTAGIEEARKQSDLTGRVWSESMGADELLDFLENRQKQYEEVSKMSIVGSNAFERLQSQQIKSNTLNRLNKEIEALKRAIHFSIEYENWLKKQGNANSGENPPKLTAAQKAWNEEYAKQMEALKSKRLSNAVALHIEKQTEKKALLKDAQKDSSMGVIGPMTPQGMGDELAFIDDTAKRLKETMEEVSSTPIVSYITKVGESLEGLQYKTQMATASWMEFTTKMKDTAKSMIVPALETIGYELGRAFGQGGFKNGELGKALIDQIMQFASMLGDQLIAIGSALLLAPGMQGAAAGYLAAGGLLKVGAAIHRGFVQASMSEDVTGGTSATGVAANGQKIELTGQIRGDHLVILSSDYQRRGR